MNPPELSPLTAAGDFSVAMPHSIGPVEPDTAVLPAASSARTTVTIAGEPTPTLRVLHVVNGEHFSGAERVQSHLGRCLPRFGVTADFACVKPGRFADMLDERTDPTSADYWGRGIRVAMRHRLDWSAATTLADVAIDGGYDLMHAHTPRTAMLTSAASRRSGIPWIYHVHSPASRDGGRRLANAVNAWMESRSLRNASHQIAVSHSLREDLIAHGASPDHVSVVHNGVPAIRPMRTTKPCAGGRWTIGMIALMRPRKGLEVALEALSILDQRDIDVTLRCIGPFETDAYRRRVDSQIRNLGIGHRIDWVGFTNRIPAELVQLDAMVLPSLYGEGLPMVVLEAMAAAVPVIATRVEGTPEAIRHGVEGLLAQPQDPASLADEIESLVNGHHDWETMAEAAATRHGAAFSDAAMAAGTADVYSKICSSSRST